jgi:hypothetical protein
MTTDSDSNTDEREEYDETGPELVNGDSIDERLTRITFDKSAGNSVKEIRKKLNS